MNSKNNLNFSHIKIYTQNIVFHSLNELKKKILVINKNIKASNNNPNSVNIIVFDRPNIIRVKKNFEEFYTSKM